MAGIKGMVGSGGARSNSGRKNLSSEEKKSERISFRSTAAEKKIIENFCKENGISIREIIMTYINEGEL